MTNYKNRCAELAQHLDDTLDFTISSETRKYLKALISTVRSELAEPEMEGSTPRPADGEVAELVAWMRNQVTVHEVAQTQWAKRFVRAASLLERLSPPQPQPVPVSERLPGAEDCDAEGRCWVGYLVTEEMEDEDLNPSWELCQINPDDEYWLPANALPQPS